MPGQPKFTRTVSVAVTIDPGDIVVNPIVTWNPSGEPVEFTAKDWNRGFELGDLTEWTAEDAEIESDDPYEGDYCCRLTKTDASITQTLDEPMPVNAVYEFSAWFKRKAPGDACILEMRHTDGSVNQVGAALTSAGWNRFWFDRPEMSPGKILSGIAIRSEAGDFYVDKVVLGIAAEVMTGTVEVTQATPESLQATVTPASGAEFEAVQATAEDLQVTVTPEVTAVFPVSQDTAENLQATVTPAADTEFEVVQATAGDLQAEATPRPKGGVIAKDSGATAAAYATIGSHTPAVGVDFELAKILVSCPEDVMYKLRWDGTDIGAEVYVTGGIPFVDWFPMGYYAMAGDATKIFDIRVKYPTGGSTATCHVEIVGEDVGA